MSNINPKRDGIGLMIFLVIFGTLLITAIVSFFNSTTLLDFGLSNQMTNGLIVILSLIGLIRTIWHIHHF